MTPVDVRADTGPINRTLAVASAAAGLAWWTWPGPHTPWQQDLIAWFSAACAASAAVEGGRLLVRDYRLRRDLARSKSVSSDHGTAREATWEEICAAGMNDPASGNLLGLYQQTHPVFAPLAAPFNLVEMPPGGGKTSRLVLGSIIHQAHRGKSLAISDPKGELAPMLAPALRALGFEVWCVNPAARHLDLCGDVEINPYQAVLDVAYAEDETRQDMIKRAGDLAELHLPEHRGEDKNLYFRSGSRRCITAAILYLALTDPARCTPADAFALLNDPGRFIRALQRVRKTLETAIKDDPVVAFLKTEAANLLHRAGKNEENFGSFLEGATQTMLAFNQGGRLASYGRTAIHNIADLRRRQIILFMMAPLSHTRDFAPLISLFNYNLIAAAKDASAGHPIHIVGEEALNYRFADIAGDLETMRGLGITADFYIQSYAGLVRKYGREAAASVESYAGVKVYSAVSSYERAKHVSDMLAEATIRKQDYSARNVASDLGVSSRELGRRLMTPDEVLAMPRGEAWAFVQGLRPMRLSLVHYGQVVPWSGLVGDNPVEGSKLRGETRVRLRYPKRSKP